eukprot:TRINITY_DN19563_c0_g1_i1.p1 TRINITY_DN19563_c0_g1~~TRINITY_DN19563_c0_g1_i1.p1  ORF type:complete len:467 (+),score=63.64 TRINITY_DN19563_c0_g1_i1:49-1449(+)
MQNLARHLCGWVTQSFYHQSILPLLALTCILAWLARPSTSEKFPDGFRKHLWLYLGVWAWCVAADWFQGPYVYALYSAYGFPSHDIAVLFVAGFGASMVCGCFVGSLADRFGRKRLCLAYCVLYIVSCITKHWASYGILMLGRITGGAATSLLFSCFECWMVSEHTSRHQFSQALLSYMFGLKFSIMYIVAVLAGLIAQFTVDMWPLTPIKEGSNVYVGGFCSPFDASIACLVIAFTLICFLWRENYGEKENTSAALGLLEHAKEAASQLVSDGKCLRLCLTVACFEGSMFAFVFNWTPALESKAVPPPHGVIFALFMMAAICGASVATLLSHKMPAHKQLFAVSSLGAAAFVIAGLSASRALQVCFASFLAIEFCVGWYFPSIGLVKSEVVQERIRGSMYNLFRVPLNAVVIGLLLTHLSVVACFTLCACLLGVSLLAISGLQEADKKALFEATETTALKATCHF